MLTCTCNSPAWSGNGRFRGPLAAPAHYSAAVPQTVQLRLAKQPAPPLAASTGAAVQCTGDFVRSSSSQCCSCHCRIATNACIEQMQPITCIRGPATAQDRCSWVNTYATREPETPHAKTVRLRRPVAAVAAALQLQSNFLVPPAARAALRTACHLHPAETPAGCCLRLHRHASHALQPPSLLFVPRPRPIQRQTRNDQPLVDTAVCLERLLTPDNGLISMLE